VQILQGLRAGDRVIASATFLVDSETRLKSSQPPHAAGSRPAPGHGDDDD
jgi:hypothetical protein